MTIRQVPRAQCESKRVSAPAHSDASTDWYQEGSPCHLQDILCVMGSLRLGGPFLTPLPGQCTMVPKAEQDAVGANPRLCTRLRARHLFHRRVFLLELDFLGSDLVYFPQVPLTFCLLNSDSDQEEHMATIPRKLWPA